MKVAQDATNSHEKDVSRSSKDTLVDTLESIFLRSLREKHRKHSIQKGKGVKQEQHDRLTPAIQDSKGFIVFMFSIMLILYDSLIHIRKGRPTNQV
jgi:hypothetical protein